MNGQQNPAEAGAASQRPRWWGRRWVRVVGSLGLVTCAALVGAGEYGLHHAEPLVRQRIIDTLSTRFGASVEIDRVEISLLKGVEVSGFGLRIPFRAGMGNAPAYPLIAVQRFAFRTSFRGLLRHPMHVSEVQVEGMEVHIPPAAQRAGLLGKQDGLWSLNPTVPTDSTDSRSQAKISILVEELRCRNVNVFLEPAQSGRDPLLFAISALHLRDIGPGQAMVYEAQVTNPKPYGLIQATGHLGPWVAGVRSVAVGSGSVGSGGAIPDPGQVPLDGDYTFDHADLNTLRGLGGTLSSTGHFRGVLDRIEIAGSTDTPDFSIDISNRPVPLHVDFHALVDGTSGDTYLNAVHARLAHSEFETSGKVVKVKGAGHDIQLEVNVPHGRMEDFLRLAVKTDPPLMNGMLAMHARLHIPPGHDRIPLKLEMAGSFLIAQVRFNNARWQDRVDGLSARAQGRPKEVAAFSHDHVAEFRSQLAADFKLSRGVMSVANVRYTIPGAQVLLNGVYSMDGRLFEFKGHVRTQATASQMVGGWKGLLLKPVDPFLKKDGAGLELPVEVSGTGGDLHVGLAMHGTDDTPQEMLADVRAKGRGRRDLSAARHEAARADTEDAQAARAPTLAAAEQAHQAAVRHRAEAMSRALDAKGATAPQQR